MRRDGSMTPEIGHTCNFTFFRRVKPCIRSLALAPCAFSEGAAAEHAAVTPSPRRFLRHIQLIDCPELSQVVLST